MNGPAGLNGRQRIEIEGSRGKIIHPGGSASPKSKGISPVAAAMRGDRHLTRMALAAGYRAIGRRADDALMNAAAPSILRRYPDHSGLMPANFATLPHFLASAST